MVAVREPVAVVDRASAWGRGRGGGPQLGGPAGGEDRLAGGSAGGGLKAAEKIAVLAVSAGARHLAGSRR